MKATTKTGNPKPSIATPMNTIHSTGNTAATISPAATATSPRPIDCGSPKRRTMRDDRRPPAIGPDALDADNHPDERGRLVEGVDHGEDGRLHEADHQQRDRHGCDGVEEHVVAADVAHPGQQFVAPVLLLALRRLLVHLEQHDHQTCEHERCRVDHRDPAPPNAVYRPAPMSGPTRRSASLLVASDAFASTSMSSGSISLSSPLSAAGITTNEAP